MDTGQLRGSIGTPDNPRLTFEEAIRQHGTDRDPVLWVGQDIISTGEDEFLKKRSETDLRRIRNQVDEEQLPRLPPDVLPGGWDALGRPRALTDCPAERVPQIPSVHGTSQVTVAALVSFPPEPFFFVNLVHLDGAILVKNKLGHSAYSGLQRELEQNRTLKDASLTYGRVKPPRYKDSVPVQECLKEPRWSAYREGRWGNRIKPPAPAGDVRPETAANVPVGERLVSSTDPVPLEDEGTSDDSSGSHPSSSSPDSSPGPRQQIRRLTHRMYYSEPEEVSGSTTGEAVDSLATTFPALCGPSSATPAEEAHVIPAARSPMEADEPTAVDASPVIVQTSRVRNRLSQARSEGTLQRTGSQDARSETPEDQSPPSQPVTPVIPQGPGFGWGPIDTDSWEDYEDAARRASQGIVRRTINYAADNMDLLRTEVDTQVGRRVEALQKAGHSEELQKSGGDGRADGTNPRSRCDRLNREREAFQRQVTELQAVNAELVVDLEQASLAIDICLPCVSAPPEAPVTLEKPMLALVTSVGKRSVRRPQLSAPSHLTLPRGPLPSALDTPMSQLTPTLTTPVGRPPFGPPPRTLVPFPRPTQPASASLAAPMGQESDWEAEMVPVPEGPESQQ